MKYTKKIINVLLIVLLSFVFAVVNASAQGVTQADIDAAKAVIQEARDNIAKGKTDHGQAVADLDQEKTDQYASIEQNVQAAIDTAKAEIDKQGEDQKKILNGEVDVAYNKEFAALQEILDQINAFENELNDFEQAVNTAEGNLAGQQPNALPPDVQVDTRVDTDKEFTETKVIQIE